jgi:hypothetical protein
MMKSVIFAILAFAIAFASAQTAPSGHGIPDAYCAAVAQNNNVELAAPVFVAAGSTLTSSALVLNFLADDRFSSIAFTFASGSQSTTSNGYCNAVASNSTSLSTSSSLWAQVDTATTACGNTTLTATFDPRTALGDCFNFDNSSNTNYVLYTAIVQVVTTQNRNPIRGTAITRTTQTALQLQFQFQRIITVNSTSLTVVGTSVVYSDIITQSFSTSTLLTEIQLYTSVQQPYHLIAGGPNGESYISLDNANYSTSGLTTVPSFASNNAYNNGAGANLGCNAGGVNNAGNLTASGATTPNACVQVWTVYLAAAAGVCNYQVDIQFTFTVNTTSDYLGEFVATSFTTTYSLASNDFCAQTVATISLTGTLTPYGVLPTDPTNPGTQLYNYLYGQQVYFLAAITASAGPSITSVDFVSGNVQSVSSIGNDFAITLTGSLDDGTAYGFATSNYAPTNPTYSQFNFLVSASTVQLDDPDTAQPVAVSALFRVAYQNLNQGSEKFVQLASSKQLFDTTSANQNLDLTTTVGVTRPAATASGSSSMIAMVAGIASGCVALTAFVALFLYRRASNKFDEQASAPVDAKELEALEKRLEGTAV